MSVGQSVCPSAGPLVRQTLPIICIIEHYKGRKIVFEHFISVRTTNRPTDRRTDCRARWLIQLRARDLWRSALFYQQISLQLLQMKRQMLALTLCNPHCPFHYSSHTSIIWGLLLSWPGPKFIMKTDLIDPYEINLMRFHYHLILTSSFMLYLTNSGSSERPLKPTKQVHLFFAIFVLVTFP